MQDYVIKTGFDQMDFEVIYGFISNSYWAKGIPREVLDKALRHSLCFGLFDTEDQQVGFGRMVTDKATFAYLADVFIVPASRGKGLSKYLIQQILHHPELQGLRRIMLATKDAHGLYEKYGFKRVEDPERLMQIRQPNIYQDVNICQEVKE